MSDTYTMKFRCANCFHVWEQEIPKGQIIDRGSWGHGCYIGNSMNSEIVECPNCGTHEKVNKDI